METGKSKKLQAIQKVLNSPTPTQRRHRRYNPNDCVLIEVDANHNSISCHSKNLVNHLGFSKDQDENIPKVEPYKYTLATVLRVHFDENIEYYTVRRENTDEEIRADSINMYPILTKSGLDAAKNSAMAAGGGDGTGFNTRRTGRNRETVVGKFFQAVTAKSSSSSSLNATNANNNANGRYNNRSYMHIFSLRFNSNRYIEQINENSCLHTTKHICYNIYKYIVIKAELFLKGQKPFFCSLRLTGINIVVLCSIWYAFMDMLILSIPPQDSSNGDDRILTIVGCVVWFVLSIELLLEVFIRPDGYRSVMLLSEKAYSPITARFINTFHLFFEVISLFLYIPGKSYNQISSLQYFDSNFQFQCM